MNKPKKPMQQKLVFSRRGGKRRGAGRKPKGAKPGVPHERRESFKPSTPLHVTVSVRKGVPNLRSRKAKRIVMGCIRAASERLGMRLTQFSIQANHIHLIVEAKDRWALSRAMKGFSVRIARRLNRAYGRRGKVFADRFHSHVLRTPLEVQNAVRYVMNNSRIHAERRGESWNLTVDPFAGGPCPRRFLASCRALLAEPRSFVLRKVWGLPWIRRTVAAPPAPTLPRLLLAGRVSEPRLAWRLGEAAPPRYRVSGRNLLHLGPRSEIRLAA